MAAQHPALGRACPVLRSDRLILRPHGLSDFPDCYALWSNPEVMRHMGGRPFTAEEAWRRMIGYAGLWTMLGYGYWLIEEATSGRYVGEAGLADFNRPFADEGGFAPETGWMLLPLAQGKGFAHEAMTEILRWAEANLRIEHTVCMISTDNARSLHLAERLGYRETGSAQYGSRHVRLLLR
jgi:RimJ/RimL family protein N-acetyltransferase